LREILNGGADEIFVGYVPQSWLDRMGMEISPNRRYILERQITDLSMLRRFGEITRTYGAGFIVAINEHYYTPPGREILTEIVEASLLAGASGFIVSDLSLIAELAKELGSTYQIIASGEAGVYNTYSALKFVEHGASRLIFPREMRLSEMEAIVSSLVHTSVEYEAFIAREFCVNSAAYCFVSHGYGRQHFCCAHSNLILLDTQSQVESDVAAWFTQKYSSKEFIKAHNTLHRCGFCALDRLRDMGVRYLKIPGRSSSALDALYLLKSLLDKGDLSQSACRNTVGSPQFCTDGSFCYYNVAESSKSLERMGRATTGAETRPSLFLPEKKRSVLDPSENQERTKSRGERPPEVAVYIFAAIYEQSLVDELKKTGLEALVKDGHFAAEWEAETARKTLGLLSGFEIEPDMNPDIIYLGIELCGLRFLKSKNVIEKIRRLQDADYRVALVAPVAYHFIWSDLCKLLEDILEKNGRGVELVVNDIGLLFWAARNWTGHLVVGRLFNRMKRFQFCSDSKVLPAKDGISQPVDMSDEEFNCKIKAIKNEQLSCYGYPYLRDVFYNDLLLECGVRSVDMDVLPTPLTAGLSPDFDYSVYMPWTNLNHGRACPTATLLEGATVSWPTESCRASCSRYLLMPQFPWPHPPIIRRGQSTFMDCSDYIIPFYDSIQPIPGRIVFEPFVPY